MKSRATCGNEIWHAYSPQDGDVILVDGLPYVRRRFTPFLQELSGIKWSGSCRICVLMKIMYQMCPSSLCHDFNPEYLTSIHTSNKTFMVEEWRSSIANDTRDLFYNRPFKSEYMYG